MNHPAQPTRAHRTGVTPQDFDLVDPRYIVVPSLMWAAMIAAALLTTAMVDKAPTGVATPAPALADSSTWGA